MSVVVVVGNPKPRSRTFHAARRVAVELTGREPDLSVDLAELGAALLDWSDAGVAETLAAVVASELLIVASPTYKGTYTGLLKIYLDRIGGGTLARTTAIPVMVGGDLRHSLAPEVFLKPVLAELGASCPTRGLFLLESDLGADETESAGLTAWLELARPQLAGLTAGRG